MRVVERDYGLSIRGSEKYSLQEAYTSISGMGNGVHSHIVSLLGY